MIRTRQVKISFSKTNDGSFEHYFLNPCILVKLVDLAKGTADDRFFLFPFCRFEEETKILMNCFCNK